MDRISIIKILFIVLFITLGSIFIFIYEWALLGFEGIHYNVGDVIKNALLLIIPSVFLVATFEVLYFNRILRRWSFGVVLLTKTLFYLLMIILITSGLVIFNESRVQAKPLFHPEVLDFFIAYIFSPRIFTVILFWGIMVMLALFILQVNDKFGQGILIKFLLGRYHKPREEERIFMFMDLRSSTTYAEKLGHILYSKLIQDCFYELTDVAKKYGTEIYQYIGDEVVLTWKVNKGLTRNKCIRLYLDFNEVIQNNQDRYLKKYGLIPQFKAGLDLGMVTVAEVGVIKKELAYHGDVLNTASRIQGICNQFNTPLLISERLKERMNSPRIEFEFVNELQLRGKEELIKVYKLKNSSEL